MFSRGMEWEFLFALVLLKITISKSLFMLLDMVSSMSENLPLFDGQKPVPVVK